MDKYPDFELDVMHFVDELMRKARAYDRIKEIAEKRGGYVQRRSV